MNLVDRANRQRSLTTMSRTLRSGRIAANASVPTTTYTYDANGNVTKAGGWTYVWDYLNRMLASGDNNSTTTYAYDATGARVLQTSTTSTSYYPSKYFSLASTTNGVTSWATSTNYIWLGDTLLATIDQKLYNSAATGTAITRHVHPDHLGSTNVVTDASGTIAQLLDYYPYGATRVSSTTFPTNEKRQYIGQFADAQTNLNYLNARYYDGSRGQFLSQDPSHLAVGNPEQIKQISDIDQQQYLRDPQTLNSYAYARNNPIRFSDPSGKYLEISTSGTYMGWSGSIGFRVSTQGLNGFVAGGAGAGLAGYPLSASYTPGDVPHTVELTVNVGGSGAYYVGGGVSVGGQYQPQTYNLKDPQTQYSINLGMGADVYARKEVSFPILGGKPIPGLVLTPGSAYSTPNYKAAPTQNTTQYISSPNSANRTYASAAAPTYTFQLYVTPNNKIIDWYGNFVQPASSQSKK